MGVWVDGTFGAGGYARGLLEAGAEAADKRSVRLQVSAAGKALQQQVRKQGQQVSARAVAGLDEARAYLEELPMLWAKTSDAGRHAIAEAVFERIDVLGVTDYTFTLTAHAKARGWDAAFGAGVVRVKEGQSGRGERI